MEKIIFFDDYMEQQAADHTALQENARTSFEHIVIDAVSKTRRYAGLTVTKSAQAEISIAQGRFYDVDGAIYNKTSATTQSMLTYLAAASKKVIIVSAYGVENESDATVRDYLVNVSTEQIEPRPVNMTLSRDVVIAFTESAESVDPQDPPIPVGHAPVARVLLDTTQVVSITMLTDYEVSSTEDLDARTDDLETWRSDIEPRVASLGSDLAELANRLNRMSPAGALAEIKLDLARVKEALRFPQNAVSYGADFFLYTLQSDTDDTALQGYDALIMEGIRFPDANADEFELSLFSTLDPNASVVNGLLLPKFSHDLKIDSGRYQTDLGIAQYGFQTHTMKLGYMSRSRVRYGGTLWQCSNGVYWSTPGQESGEANLYDFQTWADIRTTIDPNWGINPNHYVIRTDTLWYDNWKEPFMYAVVTDNVINGAQIAQSFLVTNDVWATKLGFYITEKGGAENIIVNLVEVTNGVPDPDKTITHLVYPAASIVLGWNEIEITPVFFQKGKRYALVLTSNANHKVGMTSGQSYLEGTFFYSTDGSYYLGDLTKDLMFRIYGAKFASPQVTVEFQPINLDGGFRYVDILANMWTPESCALVFEVRLSGANEWQPLTADNAGVLASAPALAQFRARFVGTRDMQAGIKLTGSRVHVSRPKTAFKHVSEPIDVPSTTAITLKAVLEGFDDTPPHDLSAKLRIGGADEIADAVVTKLLDSDRKRYERTWTFTPAATTQFIIVFDGMTNSAQNTFHIAERTFYSE
jgi:hypothetical protein